MAYNCLEVSVDNITPIFTSSSQKRESIRQKAVESLQKVFPLVSNKYTVHAEDIRVDNQEYSPEEHKDALMRTKTLSEPVRATLVMRDNDGKEVQRVPDYTLLRLPYLTNHNTFVIDGNTFTVGNQLRMKPGVYTRRRRDEGIEAAFNIDKGANFRLSMDPAQGTFTIDYGTTKIPLYAVLKKLGIPDQEMSKYWESKLVDVNREHAGKNFDKHMDKLFAHAVPMSLREKSTDHIQDIKDALDKTILDPDVTRRTLGQAFNKVTPTTLLAASQKLLNAYKQNLDYDERDSLAYKQIHGVDDFIAEKIRLDSRQIKRKLAAKLNRAGDSPDIKTMLPSAPFTRSVNQFLTTSALSQSPDQINPLEIVDSATKITSLGEGGIENDRAVPLEARRLHSTHAAILDPVRTPESPHAGIDLRATLFASRDSAGNLYTQLRDRKGHLVPVPVEKATDSVVAFPDQDLEGKQHVDAFRGGQLVSVPTSQVDYQIPVAHALYAPTTNLIPFLDSTDGMRATMGAKMMTQALPLKGGEPPLIQVASYRPGRSMESEIGQMVVPHSPITGTISKIKNGYIFIRPRHKVAAAHPEDIKVPIYKDFPLTARTYLNDELLVKAGDKVEEGQVLADSPFAKDGQLTLGKNLHVAFMPFRGMDTNDAIAVSKSAADKLTSIHMYREGLELVPDMVTNKEKHRAYFGNKFNRVSYENLDSEGLVKPGMEVHKGDILVAALSKSQLSPDAAMLGRLHKSLVKPYQDSAVTWDRDTPGHVVDVVKSGNNVRLTVKTEEPLTLGDKLSNRYGGKGVVSAIVPDDQMIQDESGHPVDVVVSPTSVLTRLNPSQILETALGRVAEKSGKPIRVANFAPRDNVQYVRDQLKKAGIKETETVYDPQTGKHIPGILVGPQYMLKLFKTVDTQFSARGEGDDYDVNAQPSKGGITGSKSLGRMELNALLAHNARNILKEAITTKSERNDEYWRRYQLGLPPPPMKTTFAYDKFGAMLSGIGVKMDKRGNDVALLPMTDKDIMRLSRGAITKPLFVRSKDLQPEKDGLFDPVITGGLNGKNYGHIELAEPMVNPIFERPARTLLGLTGPQFNTLLKNEGGAAIKKRLNDVDIVQREKEVLEKLHKVDPEKRDDLIKELKYLRALQATGMRPSDAYVTSKIAVIPPIYRPVVPARNGDIRVADANVVTQDLMLANDLLASSKSTIASSGEDAGQLPAAREHLYESAKALYGLREPVSPRAAGRGVQGYLARISGSTPKTGFFQSKVIRKPQDISGRAVIVPDASLGMDEVGLPEEMGWQMYAPFVIKNLVSRGYEALEAKKMVDDKHPMALESLQREMQQRPVLINRAPTLRRYNILAAYPKLVPGQALRTHEFMAPIVGGDYDGDAMSITAPVSQKAVDEAKQMTLSNFILGDQYKSQMLIRPEQDAVLGLHMATLPAQGKAKHFDTQEDALAAYHRGEITLQTPVTIKHKKD